MLLKAMQQPRFAHPWVRTESFTLPGLFAPVIPSELDGLCAHLCAFCVGELAYIHDIFPIVRRKDEALYEEYRTKRMVLEAYETMSQGLLNHASSQETTLHEGTEAGTGQSETVR